MYLITAKASPNRPVIPAQGKGAVDMKEILNKRNNLRKVSSTSVEESPKEEKNYSETDDIRKKFEKFELKGMKNR